jgi:hypothetical protein
VSSANVLQLGSALLPGIAHQQYELRLPLEQADMSCAFRTSASVPASCTRPHCPLW